MTVERVGQQFLELKDGEGRRSIVRIGSIQCVSDSDELQNECLMTVANRTFVVHVPLDDLRQMLAGPAPK
jgi:hypothetical protein